MKSAVSFLDLTECENNNQHEKCINDVITNSLRDVDDIIVTIIILIHPHTSNVNTVCRKWKDMIDNVDWLKVTFAEYIYPLNKNVTVDTNLSYSIQMLHDMKNLYSKDKGYNVSKFINYVGVILNKTRVKFKTINPHTNHFDLRLDDDEGFIFCDHLGRYMKKYMHYPFVFINFHKRDINLLFHEHGHTYDLILHRKYLKLIGSDMDCKILSTEKKDDNDNLKTTDYPNDIYADSIYRAFNLGLLSVTTFIHTLFDKFDSEKIISKNYVTWSNNKESKYYGMTKQEIKDKWDVSNKLSSERGTLVHRNIEIYYNNGRFNEIYPENALFMNFHEEYVLRNNLVPYRTEWTIYDESLLLCGSIDIVYIKKDDGTNKTYPYSPDGKIHLFLMDWKTSAKLEKFNTYQSGIMECTKYVGDCNFIHYTIQQLLYVYILETNYDDYVIDGVDLVLLNKEQKKYQIEKIDRKIAEPLMNGIIKHRKQVVDKQMSTFDLNCGHIFDL